MIQIIVVFLLCIVASGCIEVMHGVAHPHSNIQAPTFCLYDDWDIMMRRIITCAAISTTCPSITGRCPIVR